MLKFLNSVRTRGFTLTNYWRRVANSAKDQAGASAVEFALIAPLLLLLIFLLIDVARLGYVQISLNSAVREGVRASSFGLSLSEITSVTVAASGNASQVADLSGNSSLQVRQVRSCSASNALGRTTEVDISIQFNWVTPVDLVLNATDNNDASLVSSRNLTAKGVMVCAG